MPTPSDVLAALRPIVDPDFGKSIVELGFVKNISIDGGRVAFAIELTTPACPVKAEFERQARERRRTLWDEVTLLLAHGLLHLLGYDHRDDAEERVMNEQAARLCAAVGRSAANVTLPRVDKRPRRIARGPERAARRARRD